VLKPSIDPHTLPILLTKKKMKRPEGISGNLFVTTFPGLSVGYATPLKPRTSVCIGTSSEALLSWARAALYIV